MTHHRCSMLELFSDSRFSIVLSSPALIFAVVLASLSLSLVAVHSSPSVDPDLPKPPFNRFNCPTLLGCSRLRNCFHPGQGSIPIRPIDHELRNSGHQIDNLIWMENGTRGLTMKKIITKNLIARSKAKGLHGEFQGNRSRRRFATVTKQEESWL
ncbi:hypothetical protein FH972_026695 [Carpinus fangiana]|uniref:Uncharacterized protein n=1 Tax=Carpinus fangiana TaxID=176857 RepID=A0A5N6L505_9ROSI|nr:hypothetical protein FH972_026695 [Carpinus fangiana]